MLPIGAYPPTKKVQRAAQNTTGQVLPPGHPAGNNKNIETQSERARKNGISVKTQKKLDHLARYRPDLLNFVAGGILSADLAYCLARGLPRYGDPMERIRKIWENATKDEKRRVVDWIIEAVRKDG